MHLQEGALAIFELCIKFSLKLEVDWIPRSSNDKADFISRIVDLMIGVWIQPCLHIWMPCGLFCFIL